VFSKKARNLFFHAAQKLLLNEASKLSLLRGIPRLKLQSFKGFLTIGQLRLNTRTLEILGFDLGGKAKNSLFSFPVGLTPFLYRNYQGTEEGRLWGKLSTF